MNFLKYIISAYQRIPATVRGFTLLESILAMLVSALVAATAWQGIRVVQEKMAGQELGSERNAELINARNIFVHDQFNSLSCEGNSNSIRFNMPDGRCVVYLISDAYLMRIYERVDTLLREGVRLQVVPDEAGNIKTLLIFQKQWLIGRTGLCSEMEYR